ncbi:MAG TPA: hypothetical protein DDZ67_01660 [Xanthomonadaceae bacterium]|nr:hypothetical protein [Xanthomonadaceae bacterium]
MSPTQRSNRPDSLIGDAVIRALAELDGEVVASVHDGVVSLSGDVADKRAKAAAEAAVAAIEGVLQVRNLINVDDGSASFGKPGAAVRGADHQGGPDSTAERDLEEDG